jgi:uncharacterized protein YprB with RNaseH-like and TPR domain
MKTLFLDIETTPILAYTWGLWDQNISIGQIVKPTEMLCFGARWGDKKKVVFKSLHHDGKEEMLKELHSLMHEADVMVGWNSTGFDHKHINREFLENGLLPPSPTKDLDLMSVTKANFRFPSNKLDYVAQALGVGSKVKHSGFSLWLDCMAGDEKAWVEMKKYQIQDVNLLLDVYDKLQPWINAHPNRALHDGVEEGCTNCASYALIPSGEVTNSTATYQRYQCMDCGKWLRSTKSMTSATITSASS